MKENEIIEILKKENEEFRRLSEEHRNLDILLSEMDNRRYLTPDEEIERKKIQNKSCLKRTGWQLL